MKSIKITLTALALVTGVATAAFADGTNGGPGNHIGVQTEATVNSAAVASPIVRPVQANDAIAQSAPQSLQVRDVRLSH